MAAFTVIDHTELGAAASSWDVTSIPSSYDHLLIKASARVDVAGANALSNMTVFVGDGSLDTGTNYSSTWLVNYSGTVESVGTGTGSAGSLYHKVNNATSTADTFTSFSIWIPNYANTTNYKQFLTATALEGASTTAYYYANILRADLWTSTAAIDEIQLLSAVGSSNFVQYSTFTLYGVTGA